MRADQQARGSESGVAHLLLLAVIVVVAAVAIVALHDSERTSSRRQAAGKTRPADAEAVAQTLGPAVVDLDVSLPGGGRASATGMVLTPAGEVVTNNHVIAEATAITARVAGTGRTYVATVLGYDATDDVAVLGLDDASGLPTIAPADASTLAAGDPIVVIGSVAGVEGVPTPLTGAVRALDQKVGAGSETLRGMVEIDVPTRAGDSGGPVADAGAKVLAMTTAAPGGNRFREQTRSDVTFAIPIDHVLAVVDRVDAGRSTSTVHVGPRAVLGVGVRPTSPDGGAGAYVVSVQSDGPAARVGIVADTIIVSIDETTIQTTRVLGTTLDHYRPGDVVRIGYVGRDGVFRARRRRTRVGPLDVTIDDVAHGGGPIDVEGPAAELLREEKSVRNEFVAVGAVHVLSDLIDLLCQHTELLCEQVQRCLAVDDDMMVGVAAGSVEVGLQCGRKVVGRAVHKDVPPGRSGSQCVGSG